LVVRTAMDSIVVVITSAPYGVENSLGGIYLSFPILAKRMRLDIILIEDGGILWPERTEGGSHRLPIDLRVDSERNGLGGGQGLC
jgi:hypothetical protein